MARGLARGFLWFGLLGSASLVPVSCGSSGGSTDGAGANQPNGSSGSGTAGGGGSDLNLAGAGSNPRAGSGGGATVLGCPLYRALCDGQCIPTSVDPQNCGGCGKVCVGDEVCSAGLCSEGCLPGLTACEHACVDLQNDSAHCGECGQACETGKGCADGRCVDVVPVAESPRKCVGGGPPIRVGDGPLGCLGDLAQTTFRWSLCSCTDLNVSAKLSTDAYDSAAGPYKPGELGGGVGVDRDVKNWSEAVNVGGTLWVAGTENYSSSGPASTIMGDLHLGGSWKASTPFNVNGAAQVVGELSGVTVKGKTKQVDAVPPACDCSEEHLIPIADIVEAHRTANDNQLIGLDPEILEGPGAPLRLDLPCGNFYFSSIQSSLDLAIHVHGRTAIYVAGDVSVSSSLAFTLEPDAELDLFVAGTLKTSDTFVFGSPNYPALSRAYVAGTGKIALSANVRLAGELYAANSQLVVWSAKNAIYGSVLAGNFQASDVTDIHYDRGVLRAGDSCDDGDGGGGNTECGSCQDCHNQACTNGVCGDCGSDADCCSPLICMNGSCEPDIVIK